MKKIIKISLLIILVGTIVFLLTPLGLNLQGEEIKTLFNDLKTNPFLPLIYVIAYIMAVVLAIPGSILTLLAGPLFGFWHGVLLVIIGSNLGCSLTFVISRFVGYDFVQKKLENYKKVNEINNRLEEKGIGYLFYMRLLPIFPFNLINYFMGITKIKYKHYAIATFFGMLPGTLFYVYLSTQLTKVRDSWLNLLWPFVLGLFLYLLQKWLLKKKA
jgi:uncharacterized membrane protein YdjX (TVP38/TMEM64 family)